jgi:hypothetical protein
VHPNGAVQDIRWRYLQYRGIREIDCLDPGGFGALTITKAITIDCDETLGGIFSRRHERHRRQHSDDRHRDPQRA